MKKNGILFSLMMLAVMLLNPVQAMAENAIDPQALVGTWVGEEQTEKDKENNATIKSVDTEVYNADGSYKSISKLTISEKMTDGITATVTIKCTVTAVGTWSLKGNKIHYTYDKKKSTLTIDDLGIKTMGINIKDPSIVDPVKEQFQKELKPEDVLSYQESTTVVSLDGNKMVQEDDGDKTTYTRK